MADVDTNANVKAAQFLASQEAGNTAEGAASSSLPSASQTGTASQFFQIEAGLNSVGEKVSPSVRELRSSSAASNADWRFRMSLGPGAKDLYAGIMAPLNSTDGVIFPYTPQIQINYRANYNKTTLTHANHPAFFYQGSEVSDLQVNATFTAQSSEEASYLMAAIHFFKATTKMYYGQDDNKGMPPPLIFLNGFGDAQFDNLTCLNTQFNYNLPDNVDYIRTATNTSNTGNPFQIQNAISSVKGGFNQGISRLLGAGVNRNVARLGGLASNLLGFNNPFGGVTDRIGSILGGFNGGSVSPSQLGANYVPTKIELAITLIPIVSRAKQTNEFSLKDFAAGKLRGHW